MLQKYKKQSNIGIPIGFFIYVAVLFLPEGILPGFTKTARLNSLIKGRADRAGSTVKEIEDGMLANVPLRRFAEPREVGAVAAFLASPAASYLNGLNLPVDGGRLAWQ